MDTVFANLPSLLVRLFAGYLEKMIKMKDRAPSPFGTYYEFGAGWGATLAAFMLAAERVASAHHLDAADFRVFSFDSFEGLPSSDHPADRHGAWARGAMASSVDTIRQKMFMILHRMAAAFVLFLLGFMLLQKARHGNLRFCQISE